MNCAQCATCRVCQVRDEDVLSYALYPQVFKDWRDFELVFGELENLPTHVFLHPLEADEEVEFEIEEGRRCYLKVTEGDGRRRDTTSPPPTVTRRPNATPRDTAQRRATPRDGSSRVARDGGLVASPRADSTRVDARGGGVSCVVARGVAWSLRCVSREDRTSPRSTPRQ